MAFENGYIVEDYFGSCIERYKQDPLVFVKVQQIFSSYMSRPDWPHCLDELDHSIHNILGSKFFNFVTFFGDKDLDSKLIEWPENLPSGFKEEFTSFYKALWPVYNQGQIARTQPMKLSGISQSLDGVGYQIIRFIRMDGQSFELQVDIGDVKEIIRTLNDLLPPESNIEG